MAALPIALIGGLFIVGMATLPFHGARATGRSRWFSFIGCFLAIMGSFGFFGAGISSAGGFNWLPGTLEWPVGYCDGIITTERGGHVVPHTPSGRIQVYDADWNFVTGWHVDASSGPFKLIDNGNGRVEVITGRRTWRYVYALNGDLIEEGDYSPLSYSSFPDEGTATFVPTVPWLLVFSHPLPSWLATMIGLMTMCAVRTPEAGKSAS